MKTSLKLSLNLCPQYLSSFPPIVIYQLNIYINLKSALEYPMTHKTTTTILAVIAMTLSYFDGILIRYNLTCHGVVVIKVRCCYR